MLWRKLCVASGRQGGRVKLFLHIVAPVGSADVGVIHSGVAADDHLRGVEFSLE